MTEQAQTYPYAANTDIILMQGRTVAVLAEILAHEDLPHATWHIRNTYRAGDTYFADYEHLMGQLGGNTDSDYLRAIGEWSIYFAAPPTWIAYDDTSDSAGSINVYATVSGINVRVWAALRETPPQYATEK